MKSKSGELSEVIMSPVFVTILILGAVLIPMNMRINALFDKSTLGGIFRTYDIALTINTLYALDGNVLFQYPNTITNNTFDIKKDGIYLYGGKDPQPIKYYPILQDELPELVETKLENPEKRIYIVKEKGQIRIEEKRPEKFSSIYCPEKIQQKFKKIFASRDFNRRDPEYTKFLDQLKKITTSEIPFIKDEIELPAETMRIKILPIFSESNKNSDHIRVQRITVDYPKSQPELAPIACQLTSSITSALENTDFQEINYFAKDIEENTIQLNVGYHYIYFKRDYPEKFGGALNDLWLKTQ